MSFTDARSFHNPLVICVDHLFQISIGQQARRNVRAQRTNFCPVQRPRTQIKFQWVGLEKSFLFSVRVGLSIKGWLDRLTSSAGNPTAHAWARCRCFLPDLAGLAGLRRVGPGTGSMIPLEEFDLQRLPCFHKVKIGKGKTPWLRLASAQQQPRIYLA